MLVSPTPTCPSSLCPDDTQYGETVCRKGKLWTLSYSEMGPPDQRQCVGPCPKCTERRLTLEGAE